MFVGYRCVLVGVDGSTTALHAADRSIELTAQCGGRLHVVDVVPLPSVGAAVGPAGAAAITATIDAGDRAASEALRATTERAAAHGVETETHLVHGDPAAAIVATAAEVGADLIVVGNRGVDPAGRYVLGSVPQSVLYGAPCDVLVVHTT